jgi:capsule polysaccharide export protein KpsE/RkpR
MTIHPDNLTDQPDDPLNLTADSAAASWQAPLLDLLCVLARYRLLLVILPVMGLSVGLLQYLRSVPFFRASAVAVLLPREQPTVDVSVLSGSVETTDDRAQRADSGLLMLPPQTDLYIALVSSRSVLEQLGARFGDRLADNHPKIARDRSDEIVKSLRDMIKVNGTEEGLLTITATAPEPELAADLANTIVEEMRSASRSIERQLLVQQAGYLEDAVLSTAAKLERAENALKTFCRENKFIDPGLQSADRLRQIRELAASRDAASSRLMQRRIEYTDADPGIRRLEVEIETKNLQIADLRSQFAGGIDETEYGRLLIEFEGLRQRVRYRRDLLSTLSTQAEVFRIRADQPSGHLAIVRPATAVARPAGPSKKKIFGLSIGAAFVAAIALALLLDQTRIVRREPSLNARVEELLATALAPPQSRWRARRQTEA